jgi:mRNA interferase MazF
MARPYVPDRGDIVWLRFGPKSGHEQSGLRPAVVISPRIYNGKVGLALFCPVTSRVKGYPFEVALPDGGPLEGVILSDQIKSLDWRARGARRAGRIPREVIDEVLAKISPLVGRE